MTKKQITSEWRGLKRKLFAWHLDSSLARLPETLLLGDCRPAVMKEFTRLIQGGEVVLDIGAGTGRFSLAIARKLSTGKVICLDLSKEMLQRLERMARKEGLEDRIEILKRDASSSGLANDSVDLALSNSVFHELSSPEAVLAEMVRVLRPGGWLIITDFRDTRISKLICGSHRRGAHGPFSVNELETHLIRGGLNSVNVSPVKHWVLGVGKK